MKIDAETGLRVWLFAAGVTALSGAVQLIGRHWLAALVVFSLMLVPIARWDWERAKLAFERGERAEARQAAEETCSDLA